MEDRPEFRDEQKQYESLLTHFRELTQDLEKVHDGLAEIDHTHVAKIRASAKSGNRDRDLREFSKKVWSDRRRRDVLFADGLFGEPAWDILLYLFSESTSEIFVKSACLSSGVPMTTALRWITLLEQSRLVERQDDPRDKRRQMIKLTSEGDAMMARYLSFALGLPADKGHAAETKPGLL